MIEMLSSDVTLQLLMFAIAVGFAGFMSWGSRDGERLRFSTYLLEAAVVEAALVVMVASVWPGLFQSLANQKAFVVVVSMMTLIYAVRDIVGDIRRDRKESQSGPADRSKTI